ncbi:MAG TPA: CDP-alcohol phosphatidyltransferase family protein [Solirubrobacteraceae bacterium]|nr:CDP-alcohol phosphatidyltransferase family protein [Solirubrobacteraceae bacterium]
MGRAPLTFRRLSGLDRSGPPPPETQAGAPLRPWTIPNAIGYLRAALIPTFLLLALSSDDGTDALPATLFAIVAWGDYADGIAARVTRQYSRMGALMDPIIDRALVIAGVIVCWKFDLLPRWMLAVMIGREVFMLLAGQYALRRGATLKINWFGRWSVWPVMSALMMGLVGLKTAGTVALAIGLVLAILATVQYGRDAIRELRTA